jgi:hypothetical protein
LAAPYDPEARRSVQRTRVTAWRRTSADAGRAGHRRIRGEQYDLTDDIVGQQRGDATIGAGDGCGDQRIARVDRLPNPIYEGKFGADEEPPS